MKAFDSDRFHKIAQQVADEFQMGGLTGSVYEEFAMEITKRYLFSDDAEPKTVEESRRYEIARAQARRLALELRWLREWVATTGFSPPDYDDLLVWKLLNEDPHDERTPR